MSSKDTFSKMMEIRNIIANEIGCPSLVEGTNPDFKYCCDERGPSRPCYCEVAARKVLTYIANQEKKDANPSTQKSLVQQVHEIFQGFEGASHLHPWNAPRREPSLLLPSPEAISSLGRSKFRSPRQVEALREAIPHLPPRRESNPEAPAYRPRPIGTIPLRADLTPIVFATILFATAIIIGVLTGVILP